MKVSREQAMKEPAAHAQINGVFVQIGKPLVPVAKQRKAQAAACEPPLPAAEDSWHMLQPPKGAGLMRMQWSTKRRDWKPTSQLGNRLAFTSEYLAAHGWEYERAATSEDIPS